jgi:hypothetical protein
MTPVLLLLVSFSDRISKTAWASLELISSYFPSGVARITSVHHTDTFCFFPIVSKVLYNYFSKHFFMAAY